MSDRRNRFAARFRKAVASSEESKRREEEAAAQALAARAAARESLLEELEQIGRDIGVIQVKRGRDGLTLRYGERTLHFAPEGTGDVLVEVEGSGDEGHRLHRQAELGDRWVYIHRRRFNREDRLPLFDQGLEELLVRGLGLPRPGEDEPEPGPSGKSL